MGSQPINTIWAENSESNKSTFNNRQFGLGITYNSIVASNQLNGLYSIITEAEQWAQRTGGYYINSKRYKYGDFVTILRTTTTNKWRREVYMCLSESQIVGIPPLTDAVEEQTSSFRIIVYSGGVENTAYWRRIYPEYQAKYENSAPDSNYVYRVAKFDPPSLTTTAPEPPTLEFSQSNLSVYVGKTVSVEVYTSADDITYEISDERKITVEKTQIEANAVSGIVTSGESEEAEEEGSDESDVSSEEFEEYGVDFRLTLKNSYGTTTCRVKAFNPLVNDNDGNNIVMPNGLNMANFDVEIFDIQTNLTSEGYSGFSEDLMPYGARLELGYTQVDNKIEYGLFLKVKSGLTMFRVETLKNNGVEVNVNESYYDSQDTTAIGASYITDVVIPIVEGASTQPKPRIGQLIDYVGDLSNELAYKRGLFKSTGVVLSGVQARVYSLLIKNLNGQKIFADTRLTTCCSLPDGVEVNDAILGNAISLNTVFKPVINTAHIYNYLGEYWTFNISNCRINFSGWPYIYQRDYGVDSSSAGSSSHNIKWTLSLTANDFIARLRTTIKNNVADGLTSDTIDLYCGSPYYNNTSPSTVWAAYVEGSAKWSSSYYYFSAFNFRLNLTSMTRQIGLNVTATTSLSFSDRQVRTGLIFHTYYFYGGQSYFNNCVITSGREVSKKYNQRRLVVDRYIQIC